MSSAVKKTGVKKVVLAYSGGLDTSAIIPWLKSSFIGHIAGVLIKDKLIEFTTYNGTKVNSC